MKKTWQASACSLPKDALYVKCKNTKTIILKHANTKPFFGGNSCPRRKDYTPSPHLRW